MTGEIRDDIARTLLQAHIRQEEIARAEDRRDRENAAAEVARKFEEQNKIVDEMHKINLAKIEALGAQVTKLMWVVIVATLTTLSALAVEFVKMAH